MFRRFRHLILGLSTNWIGIAGVVLTTTAFVLFVFMELLRVSGIVTNAYVGLVSYMALPLLFIVGLLLIPVGWARLRRQTGKTTRELLDSRFPLEMTRLTSLGSSLVGTLAVLTIANILFLGLGGARMLHFMDSARFCGTACHSVMNPEWVAYQRSPHAHVACVECHVGEGAKALVDAKLNGLWQIVSATFDLYERPIPTPVHNLRPARETCERCHWPEKFYGERVKTLVRHEFDAASTPRYTTLALKVGSGASEERGTIHWHVAPANAVRYQSVDPERLEMAWVEVKRGDSYHRYTNRALDGAATAETDAREMDCVDCHNRATHIYWDPEDAVDHALTAGGIDRAIPYAKRVALDALTGSYPVDDAAAGVARAVLGDYRREDPEALTEFGPQIDAMVATLQDIRTANVHPGMNIDWNSYPSHIGHKRSGGCFRCHNADMVDETGRAISHDCTLCHSILAYDSESPFQFLLPTDEADPDRRMHEYLRDEFLAGGP